MADIYRAIKIWNGSAWDYIYPSVCRSITFGLSADATTSSKDVNFNMTYSASENCDADASLAQLSSGKVKILKGGRYLVVAQMAVTTSTDNRMQVRIEPFTSNKKDGIIDQPMRNYSTVHSSAIASGVKKLAANAIVKMCREDASSQTLSNYFTKITFIYLGE
ncbi:MAG: hypothetical protein EUB_02863 [Eubacterium sp.]|uniref:Cgl0159 family (beta/alpha)8-fold protein n=1 Tax=Eubacterium sp. TaxID=142586 RepID=UPI003024D8D0